jgi:hypothetical protein
MAAAARLVAKVGAATGFSVVGEAGLAGALELASEVAGLAGGVEAGGGDEATGLEGGADTDVAGFDNEGRLGSLEGADAGADAAVIGVEAGGVEASGVLDLFGAVAGGVKGVTVEAGFAGGVGVDAAGLDGAGEIGVLALFGAG